MTSAAASPAGNLTHDAHQINRGFEGQRSNHMANSHAKQTDADTTLVKHGNNSTSSTPIDGGWQSSLHVNSSPNMIAEEMVESKNASAWSVISNHSAPSSGNQFNTPASGYIDVRKPDAVASCRLFGFDLKSPSVAPLKSVDIPNDAGEVCGSITLSSGDSEQKSGVPKDFRDLKQDQLQVLAKEVHSRQSNSFRSRTKVYDE